MGKCRKRASNGGRSLGECRKIARKYRENAGKCDGIARKYRENAEHVMVGRGNERKNMGKYREKCRKIARTAVLVAEYCRMMS